MHSKFLKISAALFFAAALFSCSFDAPSSDKGSISMRLPGKSQLGAACANGVSRSVSSDGSLSAGSVDQFKVVVRNLSSRESITQFVAPGSSVTVDELEPGSWDVAIFGYAIDPQGGSGQSIRYYGNARGIPVEGGETSSATVNLYDISGNMPGVSFDFSAVDLQYAFLTYSCTDLAQSGEAFYSFTTPGGTDPVKPPMPVFMEPGYNYKVKVVFYGMSSEAKYICSAEGVVPAIGGLVSGSASMVDKGFVPWTNYTAPLLLGNSPADYFKDNVSFSLEGDSVPAEDVSFHAINDKACGFTVPFIASYQEYSCLLMPGVVHPVTAPNVSVADMQVPKGETKEVAVSYNPPAPVNWPVLGQLPDTQNGFTSYGITGYDSDTWQGEADCQQSYSNYIKASDDKKSIVGIDVSPSPCPCVWTVSVTHGANGQTNDTSASANFNVSCVEAASSGGGGNGGGTSGSVVNLYVKQNGNDGNDGLSEDTAFKTIGAADKKITQLNDANANYVINIVDKLWQSNLSVDAEGNTQPLVISTAYAKSITIKGIGSNEIDGQYDYEGPGTVIKFTTNVPVLIESITIKGGCASNTINGGCIFVSSTSNVTLGQGSNVVGGRIGDGKGGGVYVENGATFVIDANAQVDSASTSEVYLEPGAMVTVGKDFETPNTIPIASIRVRDDDYEESTALQVVDNPHSKTIYNNGESYFGLIVPTDKTGHLYGYKIDNQGKIFYYNYN